ncbi:2Fe-2S iron-sulfur cluster-binding protein [Roseateles koreensis]|uniref:2Fe-2S iron-sulfur cluster-binding protein n=1 Tax=Roseateles koreensis TaxID=2987526 RepID=A0ABT5KNS5_9BURK|nr:2Fe-2S iron-sulfur cluster-binding protein [Roseateles koreensis]MDC8784575.1 2Fe-2S iron-sulfur cluster-binding protein [Roseateles koreensis]
MITHALPLTRLTLLVNGCSHPIQGPCSVAAALAQISPNGTRRSVSGQPRAAFCGMGVCQECSVTIDGQAHRLACMTPALDGMHIEAPT